MNKKYEDMLNNARECKYALGAFNVFNMISAKAVVNAAEELNLPVILEMSASVAKKIGSIQALNMLNQAKKEVEIPVTIHLDHCLDLDFAFECIKNGWKSIMFDGSTLTLEENIIQIKKLIDVAKINDVHIEGEVGVIMGTEDGVFSDVTKLANFEETMYFIEQTGVNTIAPAIGTAHGLYSGRPHINYDLIQKLSNESNSYVVIHGGTGLKKEEYRKLIECGAAKINVSTAIKHAYINGMKQAIATEHARESPLKADDIILDSIKRATKEHIILFSQLKR